MSAASDTTATANIPRTDGIASLKDENELQVPAGASLLGIPPAQLVPSSPDAARIAIAPRPGPAPRSFLLVGRQANTADIRIPHGSISRKHAFLYYNAQNECIVQDLGSKYGTTVNNARIPNGCTYSLQHGDILLFGNVRDNVFTFQREEEPSAATVSKNDPIHHPTDTNPRTSTEALLEKAGHGLCGRAQRQAEIAAMMATLETAPTYSSPKGLDGTDHKMDQAPSRIRDSRSTIAQNDSGSDAVAVDPHRTLAIQHRIPISHRWTVESESERQNVPTCLSVDPTGSRFMVGCTDRTLRFYDFGGMDRKQTRAFKTILPDDGYWPVAGIYSNTGDRILIGTGSVQPQVFDREGELIIKFVRGDMYVTDQSKTFGHTSSVTGVDWHPLERDIVLTSSLDGSARLWNLNGKTQFNMLVCDKVFQPKCSRGKRTSVLCVAFHPGGRAFVVGTSCGSIQIWNSHKVSSRPERAVYDAHGKGKAISALTYTYDGSKLLSRSSDDSTVNVWNPLKISQSPLPIAKCVGADTVHEHANAAFSPDGNVICAGVSEYENGSTGAPRRVRGRLNFYDIANSSKASSSSCDALFSVDHLPSNTGAVLVFWHPKVNQIFVGCSNGAVMVYYDPDISRKGALIASGKAGKYVDGLTELLQSRAPKGSSVITGEILTPLYNPNGAPKRKRDRTVEDEVQRREPERPATGKHKVGSASAGGALNFQQYVADQSMGASKAIAGKDPREALFKYNEGKAFVDRAYEGNHSKLAEKTAEEEEEEEMQQKNKPKYPN
jgi:WD repeat-containing protein 70